MTTSQTAGYALASTPVPGSYTATTIEYDRDATCPEDPAGGSTGGQDCRGPGLGTLPRDHRRGTCAGVTAVSVKDPAESTNRAPRTTTSAAERYFSRFRAITGRWIWLVPS